MIGVFLGYACAAGRALVDVRLYLLRSWIADPARCGRRYPRRCRVRAADDPDATGITSLRLIPEETITGRAVQQSLTADPAVEENAERADRAGQRLQALLGPDRVLSVSPSGGRTLSDRVRSVPWGDRPTGERDPNLPWPGRLPAPYPATVLASDVAVDLHDAVGADIGVTGR